MEVTLVHKANKHFWDSGEMRVFLGDKEIFPKNVNTGHGSYDIVEESDGIIIYVCYCGSGTGRNRSTNSKAREILIPRDKYSSVNVLGSPYIRPDNEHTRIAKEINGW